MRLIKIGEFEINPDQIVFIAKSVHGYEIVFQNEQIGIGHDTDAYVDLSMFITFSRQYYGNGDANEETESAQSDKAKENTA